MHQILKENYREIIESYTKSHWQPLFQLIPEIEKTTTFGKERAKEEDEEDGVLNMLGWEYAPIVLKFHEVVHSLPIIIDFHWSGWDAGRKIVGDENFDLDTISIPTKCKLITAFIRSDRFRDGALVEAFQSGIILRILKSLERQVSAASD